MISILFHQVLTFLIKSATSQSNSQLLSQGWIDPVPFKKSLGKMLEFKPCNPKVVRHANADISNIYYALSVTQ